MSSLYSQYRPKNFDSLIGQDHIVSILKAELADDKTAHAYIFIGPRGTGKTTTARILAKALNCLKLKKDGSPCDACENCKAFASGKFIDLLEIDAASNRGIDEIRDMKERIEFKPAQGQKKVYIIDEVHMLTKEAFNALLKTLEEPPEHVVFILATTEPHKVPMTILSRCEKLEFRLGTNDEILSSLKVVIKDVEIAIEESALELIVQLSGGSYRDSLSLLDTVIASAKADSALTREEVSKILGLPDYELVAAYVAALASGNESKALEALESVFQKGTHIPQFIKTVITVFRDYVVNSHSAIPEISVFTKQQLVKIITLLLDAYTSQKNAFDPRLPLQLATMQIVEMVSGTVMHANVQVASHTNNVATVKIAQAEKKEELEKEEPKTLKETATAPAVLAMSESIVPEKKKKKLKKKMKKQTPVEFKEITLEEVVTGWKTFLKAVQAYNTHLYPVLLTSMPRQLARDEIMHAYKLELAVKFEFHKKRIESPSLKPVFDKICIETFGAPVQFVCVIDKDLTIGSVRSMESPRGASDTTPSVQKAAQAPSESLETAFDDIMGSEVEQLASF